MSGATVATAVVGSAVSAGASAIFGGGGGAAGGGGSSGGGGGLNVGQTELAYKGPSPYQNNVQFGGNESPKLKEMSPSKATEGKAATKWSISSVPTQGSEQNAASANADYKNYWADRLSRYLDYNTRSLG